jgi:transcriptional regulator EpsA
MTQAYKLSEDERVDLFDTVEASYRVVNRHQLFVWMQGQFQRFIPHEIFLCGIDDGSSQGMGMHRFSSTRYFRDEHFNALCDQQLGLVPRLYNLTERMRETVVLCSGIADSEEDAELVSLITSNELKNLVARFVVGPRGKVQALYSFARVSCNLDGNLAYRLELLAPHLHSTFLRVLANERKATGANNQRSGRLITPREEQILYLIKDGKTNQEIASLLDVSPWTIKNHIQAIFKKLNTNTRTHAIMVAINMGILQLD